VVLLTAPSAAAGSPVLSGVPSDILAEATSSSGATVTWDAPTATDVEDGSLPVTCAPDSGSSFDLTDTLVTCSATDSDSNTTSESFTVTVQDTTPPDVTVPSPLTQEATGPSGAVVTFSASASDTVSGSLTPSCSPSSGDTFAVGTTNVTCSATDSSSNTGSASFNVTVQDTTKPSVSVPGNITTEATESAGAAVSFSATGSDLVDGTFPADCSPSSGSTFGVGTTTVTCTATDSHGNTSDPDSFSVTVRDTTAPDVSVPSSATAEATGPSGAAVSFSASASDILDGTLSANCSPSSGSTFPLGTTTVNCSATDSHGNTGGASFGVTVQDTSPPVLSGVPAPLVAEADSAAGSRVTFGSPTASDVVDGGVPVSCSPASGSVFGLGQKHVTCTATDAHGNTGTATFTVTVQDTTRPALNVPVAATLSSHGAPELPSTDPQVASFLGAASASDSVDGRVPVANDAPTVLPLGTTTITFTATDQAGNVAVARSRITVITGTAPPPNLDTTPPGEVGGLRAKAGDKLVDFTWTLPTDKDFSRVTVTRSPGKNGAADTVVYSGGGKHLKDVGLKNGTEYRYVFVSWDKTGNRSTGIAARATPKAVLLVAPADGAVVTKPPLLRWVAVGGATYYNLQLYFLGRAAFSTQHLGPKVLSVWPKKNRYPLTKKWKYAGRVRRLVPGRYVWFIWPGLGEKAANHYGPLLGQSTFVVKKKR
jgi:HYR domain